MEVKMSSVSDFSGLLLAAILNNTGGVVVGARQPLKVQDGDNLRPD
jgi:hypothetical protein